ncbi:MFS transporter [Bradyrhizobium diazoefficiens]|nr:MFS transporter [Bradyrhizobium diazoefficiens]UCF53326.1 MAG: MFS transporter [Bradyrhizobium sp.]MBR0964160.1 MFS transporter [Bradyrhizobium diazoefficiens]MBR0978320.1 MFS transporter [Bradyrhizobium diazoefficiens]MBR1006251.1 MFS transporter [Bradyrhizobium diazoefficiens]MBR1014303.1 MFS transporter [Bradyrhizobium diazoefficiens]
MRFLKSGSGMIGVLLVLAITQLIGWATITLPAVVGREFAADLGLSLPAVFAGNSVFYVTMGLCAPWLGKVFTRHGARKVMMVGTVVTVPGYIVLSLARDPLLYFAGWVLLGMGGSATLSTGAYIMLNEIAGRQAKSAIGALMLVSGLSSSIFWPTTSFLSDHFGWRITCLAYAAMLLLISLPLLAFGAPRRRVSRGEAAPAVTPSRISRASTLPRSTFVLVVCAITLNAFVQFGLGAVLIELLRAEGLSPAQAIAFGSMLGVIQVSARGLDFLGGGRWDGITTGLVAGAALPVAMLLLMISEGATWAVAVFILLYGAGSGAMAVARATIPLVFYDQAEFAKAMSMIALPLNLASAISPPLLAGLLTQFGSRGALGLTLVFSCATVLILVLLGRRRPRVAAAVAA